MKKTLLENFKENLNSMNMFDMYRILSNSETNPEEELITKTLAQLFLESLRWSNASLTIEIDPEDIDINYVIAEFERLGYTADPYEEQNKIYLFISW